MGKDAESLKNLIGKTPYFKVEPKDVQITINEFSSNIVKINLEEVVEFEGMPLEKLEIQVKNIGSLEFNKQDKSVRFKSMNIDGI